MILNDISDAENQLVIGAAQEYGEYYKHVQFAVDYLHSCMKSASPEAAFFAMFFSVVEKHIILATLSAVRLHHVQATFDLRYATESAAWAAFAIAHPDPKHFGETTDGIFNPTDKTKTEMHKWLEKNYPAGSESLKRFKKGTNLLSTHSNMVDAHRNFGGLGDDKISTSFFDDSADYHVKTDLWAAANLSMGALDLFYGVNRDYSVIVWQDDFLARMNTLRAKDAELKKEMMNLPQLKRFENHPQRKT